MTPPRTVRVRIAVAVSPDGDWNAAGHSGGGGSAMAVVALQSMYDARVTWVEADVPLPVPAVVEGEGKP
jgi:hypothetical protein